MASKAPVVPAGIQGPSQGLTGPMTATGPVGPAPMAIPQPLKKSPWDSFVDAINPSPQGPQLTPEESMRQAAQRKLDALATGALPATSLTGGGRNNILTKVVTKIDHTTSDILLQVAKAANDYVIKPLITTPISTAFIASDPKSALYKDGFQPSDFTKAVDRANKVSPAQALASNSLFQETPPGIIAQGLSNVFNGPDFSKVNVFSDKSIKENYSDNVFGKIFTGSVDVAIQFPAFGALGKVASGLGDIYRTTAGMAIKNAPLEDVLKVAQQNGNNGIMHAVSGGAQGVKTNFGDSLIKMSQTTSPSETYKLFKPYSNNRALDPFIAQETNPHKILDLILADNGDLAAQGRAIENSRLASYAAMGGKDAVVSKMVTSGGAWLPEGSTLNRLKDVHVDSIKMVPEHERLWNAFNDPKFDSTQMFGTGKFPQEGPLARGAYNVGGWVERTVGGHNNVVTRLVSLSGSRLPNWYISFSNTTPWKALSEIENSFNSVKMFRNPANRIVLGPNTSITAKEYIENVKNNYLNATNDLERRNVLESVDSEIGLHMAMTKGFYEKDATEQVIKDLKARNQTNHAYMVQNGTGMDIRGNMVAVDMKTQSQLASSYRMFPWNRVEKELDYHQANMFGKIGEKQSFIPGKTKFGYTPGKAQLKAENFLQDAFRKMGEYMSLDMIGAPKYVWKQSLAEPTVGAWIALGPRYLSENLPHGVGNFFANNTARISEQLTKMGQYTSGERKAIVDKVAGLGQELHAALSSHRDLEDEFNAFFVQKTKTGKTVELYGDEVKQAYKDSAKVVKQAEDEYRLATRQFGPMPEVPSHASISRRIDYLEKHVPGGSPQVRVDILRIRKELGLIKGSSTIKSQGLFNSEGVDATEKALTESYAKVDALFKKLGIAQGERADIFGKTVELKQRKYGPGDSYRLIGTGKNAKWMRMPEVYDQNAVGEALKAETGNVATSAMTYANELTASTRAGIFRRHTPTTVTDVMDPLYYNELAQLINPMYRQDIFIKEILSGKSTDQLLEWASSKTGQRYMQDMGISDPIDAVSHVYDTHALVNRYVPSKDLQQTLLKREITAPELEKALHPYVDQLVPIHPRDFSYIERNSGLGTGAASAISNFIDKLSTNVFTNIMKPENPIRHAFVRQLAMDINARKATYLASQGVDITFKELESLRQASFVQAADEMRKIFYTVPNPNRMIYASRMITMFPTATFNAFYRYARMAVKYPVNTLGFLHTYNSMFTSFGIDQNGNPVKDTRDAQYLVLPLTKDLGMFSGQGIRISARSIGFMLNTPSLTPYVALPVSRVVQNMPSADATLRNLLGSTYDTVFPMGTSKTDFFTALTPTWLRDGVSQLRSPMAKTMYANSVQSLYDYHQVKVSMGIEKSMPTLPQIEAEANRLYTVKAWFEFFFMPVKVDTTPMSVYQQLYYGLQTQYKNQGKDAVEASKLAGQEFLATVGPNFPLDQITFVGSPAKANIAKTQEGYARVYKDNVDLTRQLVHIDPTNPFLVGLLTADIDVTSANRSAVVAQKLGQPNATLPDIGGVVALNDMRLSPEQIQTQRLNQRTWDKFFEIKAQLDTVAQGYKNSRGVPYKSMDSIPEFQQALKKYAIDVLGKENPTWLKGDYNLQKSEAKSTAYAEGFNLIVNNKKFMDAQKNVPFWKSAQEFVTFRNLFADAYNAFPSGQQKTAYKNAYVANLFGDATANPPIEGQIGTYDPKLQRIITMYFANDALTKVG